MSQSAHRSEVNDCRFNQSGSLLASASTDCTARVWDAVTGRLKATMRASESTGAQPMMCVDINGSYLATGSNDHSARIWDIGTERCRVSSLSPCHTLTVAS